MKTDRRSTIPPLFHQIVFCRCANRESFTKSCTSLYSKYIHSARIESSVGPTPAIHCSQIVRCPLHVFTSKNSRFHCIVRIFIKKSNTRRTFRWTLECRFEFDIKLLLICVISECFARWKSAISSDKRNESRMKFSSHLYFYYCSLSSNRFHFYNLLVCNEVIAFLTVYQELEKLWSMRFHRYILYHMIITRTKCCVPIFATSVASTTLGSTSTRLTVSLERTEICTFGSFLIFGSCNRAINWVKSDCFPKKIFATAHIFKKSLFKWIALNLILHLYGAWRPRVSNVCIFLPSSKDSILKPPKPRGLN